MTTTVRTRTWAVAAAWTLTVLGCGSQATTATEPQTAGDTPAGIGLPNEREPLPDVITGGQPDRAMLERAQQQGVTLVVRLRAEGEPLQAEQAEWAEQLGMQLVHIPVAGAAGLTQDNARALDAALAQNEGRALVHCGSGNRAGALLALRAFYVQQLAPEQALQLGEDAGLTRLRDAVKAQLTSKTD